MVLCLSPTGLSVARALRETGARVYGHDPDPLEIGRCSSLMRALPGAPSRGAGPRLIEALLEFAARSPSPPVLFTAGDDQIEWVAEHHGALGERYRLQGCAAPEVVRRLVDKRPFYDWMATLGADLPATHFPAALGDVEKVAPRLSYPAILKPARGHAWRRHLHGAKVVQVRNADELLDAYRIQARFDPALLIQEVVPGPEREIAVAACAVAQDGRSLGVVTARKSRQYPYFFGSASYCVSEWMPDIAELSLHLLARMHFRGLCGTEFKRDPRTGRWRLIEINPRPTLWYDLARAAGVNLVDAVYRDLAGLPPKPVASQRDGVCWRYLARDWVACAKAWGRRDPDAPRLVEALRCPDVEAIAWWRDPLATLFYPLYVLLHAGRHLV